MSGPRLALWGLLVLAAGLAPALVLGRLSRGGEEPEPEDYGPSPELRVWIGQGANVSVDVGDLGAELRTSGGEKPLRWKGGSFLVGRAGGQFRHSGLQQAADWVELAPADGLFRYGGNGYLGRIRFTADGPDAMDLVEALESEPYVARVVQAEMGADWPMETLKAQAVVARTFALFHARSQRRARWDLFGDSRSLAYSRHDPSPRVVRAVKETAGLVLSWKGGLFPAYFVSTCGGQTDRAALSFPDAGNLPPLAGVTCSHCGGSPHFAWIADFTAAQAEQALGSWITSGGGLEEVQVSLVERDRPLEVTVTARSGESRVMPASTFRKALNRQAGRETLKSLHFAVLPAADGFRVEGHGWGWHGTGMCQYGAKAMGRARRTCREILEFYYPGAALARAWRLPGQG